MGRTDPDDWAAVRRAGRAAARSRRPCNRHRHLEPGALAMSFDGLPIPVIDHTGAEDGAPNAVLLRLAPIGFGRAICGDLVAAERREWWIGNGKGAYAAGTIAQTLTRRYHGLLVAPVNPPLGRHLVLAKADATLRSGSRSWHLFTNRWSGGAIDPSGYFNIESFELDGRMPVWRYACGEFTVEHRI